MADIPHIQFPFTLTAAGVNVVEQNSAEHIISSVSTVIAYPKGYRSDKPDFGVRYLGFSNAPIDTTSLADDISRWETRAQITVDEYADETSDQNRHVQITVTGGTGQSVVAFDGPLPNN